MCNHFEHRTDGAAKGNSSWNGVSGQTQGGALQKADIICRRRATYGNADVVLSLSLSGSFHVKKQKE